MLLQAAMPFRVTGMRGARLGQHFLNASWVARDLIESLHRKPDETVLEIGPGRGALTKELLKSGARVIAIEKDEALCIELRTTFSKEIASGVLQLVKADIRDVNSTTLGLTQGSYAVAANIPYYITGEIIRLFLTTPAQPRTMALLIQKEVAERIYALDGKESILSLSVKAYGAPSIVAKVPRTCFNPPPTVDSAILLIERISRDFFDSISEEAFFHLVRAGFASKRKMLASNVKNIVPDVVAAFASCGISEKTRAEDVPLEGWKCLAKRCV